MGLKKIVLDWETANYLKESLTDKLRSWGIVPDAVVGILPGGYFSARFLAKGLGVSAALVALDGSLFKPSRPVKNAILIMDQAIESRSYEIAESKIKKADSIEIRRAAFISYKGLYSPEIFAVQYKPIRGLFFKKPSAILPWEKESPLYDERLSLIHI